MGLRKRRPGLLYYRVRLPCLHFVILASASRVDLRQTTQTDVAIRFFISKYNSPLLGILVSLVGIASLIPYLVLQLKGLGLIVSATSYGQIPPSAAVWIGAVSITIYVMISGIHGSAWISVVKDIMILGIVLYLGIYLPIHYYGGFTEMFKQIDAAKPGFLTLPETGQSVSWFSSTVLLTALGFYMWPHTFAASYSAEHPRVFRKNAIIMPLYQLVLLFVIFTGFAAILQVPGLKGRTRISPY